jgi:hypothetical protein
MSPRPRIAPGDGPPTKIGARRYSIWWRTRTPVWDRDELGTGEMWNSNSVIAWVIATSGIETESIRAPAGGRAPGWQAGIEVARRQRSSVAHL